MNSKFHSYFRILTLALGVLLSACQHPRVRDNRPITHPFNGRSESGFASWYGDQFNGRKTASGEVYDMYAMTAAHRSAPFGTMVRVTNLDNDQQVVVRINDRGPFVRGRIIDLSKKAAQDIGMIGSGTAKVRLEFTGKSTQATSTPATPASAGTTGTAYIQVASFESQENAQLFLSNFQRTVPNISARIYNENDLYRVRTGPYATDDAAQNDLMNLKRLNFDAFVLHTN